MAYLNCMADMWLFNSLNEAEKDDIRKLFRRPEYLKDECLFNEGEPANSVFIVAKGRIKLFKTSEFGKEIVLGYLTANQLFGEEVLFDDSLRSFAAVAAEDTRLCACYKSDFEGLLATNSQLSLKVIKTMGDKLRRITEQLADVAIYDTRISLSRTLARLATEHGQETLDGMKLNFRLTHDDLGALVGASRVMITNVMRSLKLAGIVKDDIDHRLVISKWFLKEPLAEDPFSPVGSPANCECFQR
ncbi:cAMP-binding domain of CRP or a regulatory subunit of cAMP-dependent protein kinase [Dehalogenimonas formicexedens]|uniref:cAMP-binding domain of CRP or a regulatory subunit of cAMP-dependent protein kinase n=1 Tax=Dehalogenimonas formicexedens TaxID=1839801 RepID=A0A1P8F5Z3_9CHLR|nr:Crp/Fnr family transcriptional regulator [Dehalogenimonas formicexedens]APV43858.1 cAMP-binding domain of CRP or a regulatory subunit of cAMP-dependent protein kinase [Dehalogenimonas formicexedens]